MTLTFVDILLYRDRIKSAYKSSDEYAKKQK